MAKNIVICCDGTGNEVGDNNSNVVKLYSTLIVNQNQVGYYHPGVGTMGAPGALSWAGRHWTRLKGLAFGFGLSDNVGDAYRYLMDAYEDGDRIFLFGFSRGAYTARALAGLMHMYGLLCPGNQGHIPYILQMFAQRSRNAAGMQHTLQVADLFKHIFSRDVLLHFVGVWDTVSSVGWVYDPVVLPFSGRNPIMKTGRHAVSIDERRCFYRDNLWGAPIQPGDPTYRVQQDIKQVWFAGVHSDVGGSYAEAESGLSKITLDWMLGEAASCGLLIDDQKAKEILGRAPKRFEWLPDYVQPNPAAWLHKSLHGTWWTLELFPRQHYDKRLQRPKWRIPLGVRRYVPEGSVLHESVLDRKNAGVGYNPLNLPQNFETERKKTVALELGVAP